VAILGQAPVFSSGPVKGLLRSGGLLIASGDDSLVGLDARLDEVWRLELGTSALPVLSKGLLYIPGEKELILVDAATGAIHARGPALGYGAKLAPYPGGVVASGLSELTLVNSGSAETGAAFPLEGGSVAAVLHGADLLVARAVGGLALVDPETGAIIAEAPGPISPWLMVFDNLAILAGLPEEDGAGGQASTGGLLVAYSLPSLSRLWSSPLDFTPQAEPAVGSSGIFVWGQGYLQQFSLAGEALQEKGAVCSPPLVTKAGVFYGLFTGHLVWASSDKLQPKAFLRLPAALSARPIPWDGNLRLPLVDGSVVSLDPGKMENLPAGDQRF
jgi:outer membrane protein assembly factor BamB